MSVREEDDVALNSLHSGVLAYNLMILEFGIQNLPISVYQKHISGKIRL